MSGTSHTPVCRLALALLGVMSLSCSQTVAGARATPTWLAPSQLSAVGQNAQKPQVAVDASGDAVVVWERFNGATNVVEAASRAAGGGAWQVPVVVSSEAEAAYSPQVAIDARGGAALVWESYNGSEYSAQASVRSSVSAGWQPQVQLHTLGAMLEAEPELAIDPRGDTVAIWQRTSGSEGIVEAASMPAGGTWQTPQALSHSSATMHPARVGLDAAGDATAVWEQQSAGEIRTAAAERSAGGTWGVPTLISEAGANANEPRVAVDAGGDAASIWERPNGEEIVEAATKPAASSAWSSPVALTKPETGKGEPGNQQLAIDGRGDVVAVWGRMNETHETIEATEGTVAGPTFSAPVALSGPGVTAEEAPQLAVNAAGEAVAVWERPSGAGGVVEAATGLASAGAWQKAQPLSAGGEEAHEPQVAVDGDGDAVAAWTRYDGVGAYRAEAAGFDASGPELDALQIPSQGTVGQALVFSVSPFDVWSALGATTWSFGDATSATSTRVTHAFAAPGLYSVSLSSSDALGNTTATTGMVSIAPAPSSSAPAPVSVQITDARLTHTRFRVAKRTTAIAAVVKASLGTSFRFTLSRPAALRIAFTHAVAGLRSGGRCRAPTQRLRRAHARRCTRTLVVGAIARAHEHQGSDSVSFSGRIGHKPLTPGSYRAVLVASTEGAVSEPVALLFVVLH